LPIEAVGDGALVHAEAASKLVHGRIGLVARGNFSGFRLGEAPLALAVVAWS
jgi:hypothetical protein